MRVEFVPPLFQVRPARPNAAWTCVSLVALGLLAWPSTSSAAATSPDSAGLVGSSPERPTLPFKLWARSPKSPLKPRRRDLREPELRLKMGDDFDPRWMRTHAYHGPDPPEGPRQSVQKLVALAAREALPDDLNPAARETVRAWLVRRATCPVRYQWGDLGPYFWPRWVRRGQCASDGDGQTTTTPATAPLPLSDTPFPKSLGNAAARNVSRGEGNAASGVMGEAAGQRPCSWPPGMRCVPSAAKVLQLLRWHCRLRKSALSNSVWVQAADRKKRRRHRFRCQWLKVPYPVAEDCTCA